MARVTGFEPAPSGQQPPGATGVWGDSSTGTGVFGSGRVGVFGNSFAGQVGVQALSTGQAGGFGAFAASFGPAGIGLVASGGQMGVRAVTGNTSQQAAAIVGENVSDQNLQPGRRGLAGLFLGDIRLTGTFLFGHARLEIDHPEDPAKRTLSHSIVQSPEMMTVYSGNITTDADGVAKVTLPNYVDALNEDYRYQLTVMGTPALAVIAEEITENAFTIKTDRPSVKVSWQVTGIRRDPWALANRTPVENDKPAEQVGQYLHPEAWGGPGLLRGREALNNEQIIESAKLMPEPLQEPVRRYFEGLLDENVNAAELQALADEISRQRDTGA